jgi:hypothetical protein
MDARPTQRRVPTRLPGDQQAAEKLLPRAKGFCVSHLILAESRTTNHLKALPKKHPLWPKLCGLIRPIWQFSRSPAIHTKALWQTILRREG